MKKVKQIWFSKEKGEWKPYFELEDGKFIETRYFPTGSCWCMTFNESSPDTIS